MMNAVEELEAASDLCGRIDFAGRKADLAASVVQPVACFLGAEMAVFRVFCVSQGAAKLNTVVGVDIPDSASDAYLTRYFKLDPARRLLQQRFTRPLFAHSTNHGEWSNEQATPEMLRRYREEFLRYRREFLLPNRFYHHLGFCFQDPCGQTLLFDFHRVARSPAFGRLEFARAKIVAIQLHAKAAQCRDADALHGPSDLGSALSARELDVAEAVALGLSNKEVAASLQISVRTVENHMRSIFAKLRVTTRTRLAAKLHEATVTPRTARTIV
jgi:DNA-binding CsgD family transcriptional regulator